ncbi:MAG: 1-deoxy-D-xylulose-5-phosphate reductoisomerase [Fimbriimonadaceae bacterium]|nr:1-deoxy-D-xylulose-5-phosphate reductoisomerase [Alphaproteobacteria bacterium]
MRAIDVKLEEILDLPPAVRSISILGSTGSIGCNTIELLQANRTRYQVEAISANSNADQLADQAIALNARIAIVADESSYATLRDRLAGTDIEAAAGETALVDAASRPVDIVMASIVGAAGLKPTMAALEHGKTVALANKECLVCAGTAFMAQAAQYGVRILPVDSEHSAIFQALGDRGQQGLEQIILTASGGPFRTWPLEKMRTITPAQALRHPNWTMGDKVTIDSATMMNKGLELIEAHHLFDLPGNRIDILVHPESIVHGMISYNDGSVIAQMGAPDMRTPIAVALAWPDRMHAPVERLDLAAVGSLNFEAPDETRFPAIGLARWALDKGDGAATMLNAANEIAVAAFLEGKIAYMDIARIVETTLEKGETQFAVKGGDLDLLLYVDREARRLAADLVDVCESDAAVES